MPKLNEIKSAIERVVAGGVDGADVEHIQEAMRDGRIALSTGDRAVSITGDASGAVIITGDDNVLLSLKESDAATLKQLLAGAMMPRHGSAPAAPPRMFGRAEELRRLKERLGASGERSDGVTSPFTVVRGYPGVGKTTLAAALAHDADVATAFPDGTLWVTLGQIPDLLNALAGWGRALGTDELLRARDVNEASARLTSLLRDKRTLLIVDDVWEASHAVPFKVGGRGCATLLTTRLSRVAHDVAATPDDVYRLPVLKPKAALELMMALAPEVAAKHPQQVRELIGVLDGLPLALQVAGRLLNAEARYGLQVTDLLAELHEGTRLLSAEAPADHADLTNQTTPTVTTLLQKSTERLDGATRDCFAYLGVFAPEPASFDLAALRAVWQLLDPTPVVRTLVDRGLIETSGSGRYQMHALLVSHARSLLTP